MSQINIAGQTRTRPHVLAIFLRIALGVILIWKAINFAHDTAALELLMGKEDETLVTKSDAVFVLSLSVITVVCGVFILVGRFTRVTAFAQLPVFLIGTLFIHGGHIERYGFELILTAVVPFLLLVFITRGNHALTNNEYSRMEDETRVRRPRGQLVY